MLHKNVDLGDNVTVACKKEECTVFKMKNDTDEQTIANTH